MLLNVIGFVDGRDQPACTEQGQPGRAVNILEPTTNLLLKYNPEYTCLLLGANWYLDNGGYAAYGGGNGRTLQLDVALLLGNDPYTYPDNLPIVAAKGGPGGKPGCGSLPDATKNFPVRQLVTNTGGAPAWTSGPTPASGIPAGPTTSR